MHISAKVQADAPVKNTGKTGYNSGKRELQSAGRIIEEGKCEKLFYIQVKMAIG
jgi:hypothetical protein